MVREIMYTRKRTVIACNFCRRRKRKCDGKKPCATCVDASAECAYQELPLDKIEESVPAAVTERLGRIEAILEQQFQQIYQLNARAGQSPYPTSQSDHTSENQGNLVPLPPDFNPSLESFPFLIPKNHTAVAAALITCPQVRNVVGEYEQDCFLEMEEKLPLPGLLDRIHDGPLTWPVLVSQTVDTLTANYFQYVHPHQPLFTPQMFESWQKTLLGAQNLDGNAAAICLCVYALGVLSSPQSGGEKAPETLGLEYFQPALKIIIREVLWGFRPGILACTALLLSASYFAHLGRPVHSLRMGHFASRAFLNILERQNNPTYAELDDAEVRVYWQCFMIECDGIAELDTSRSGIEPLENTMPLPHRLGQSDDRCHIYSITEYTIRRLLNRIISTLYSPDSAHQYLRLSPDPVGVWQPPCLRKLSSVSAELDRQLEQWYSSIPDYLRFSKGTSFLPDDRSRVLRLRYYMARHLIYRPFLLQTVSMQHKGRSQPQSSLVAPDSFSLPDPVVMDRCQTCIDSCVTYLYNAADMIDKRSPYLWTFSQNCIATLVLLWLAENSAPISHLVPATRPIQSVILEKLRRWAVGSSSLDIGVQIVERLMFLDHP